MKGLTQKPPSYHPDKPLIPHCHQSQEHATNNAPNKRDRSYYLPVPERSPRGLKPSNFLQVAADRGNYKGSAVTPSPPTVRIRMQFIFPDWEDGDTFVRWRFCWKETLGGCLFWGDVIVSAASNLPLFLFRKLIFLRRLLGSGKGRSGVLWLEWNKVWGGGLGCFGCLVVGIKPFSAQVSF